MVEILVDSELVFLAISSDKLIIFETLTPAAGSNSFNVTTGPWLIFLIFPSTPKSNKIFSKTFPLISFSVFFLSRSAFDGFFKKSTDGNLNLNESFFLSFKVLANGKSSWIKFSVLFVI